MAKEVIAVKILGQSEINHRYKGVEKEIRTEMVRALDSAGRFITNHMRRLIRTGAKTGELYTHFFYTDPQGRKRRRAKKRPSPHRASAPGQAPANDTGALAGSVRYSVDRTKLHLRVSVNDEAASWLEFGTKTAQPRPFINRSVRETSSKVAARTRELIKAVLNRG